MEGEVGKRALECILMPAMCAARNVRPQRDRLLQLRRRLQQQQRSPGIQEVAADLFKLYSQGLKYGAGYLPLPRARLRQRRRPLLHQSRLRLRPQRAALRHAVRAGEAAPRAPDHPDRRLHPLRGWLLRRQSGHGAPHPALHRVPRRRPPTLCHQQQAGRPHGRLRGRHARRRHRPHLQDPPRRHGPEDPNDSDATERIPETRARLFEPAPESDTDDDDAPAAPTWTPPQVACGKDPDQPLSYLHRASSLASLAVKHIDAAVAVVSSFLDPKEVAETAEMADEDAYISEDGPYPEED